MARGRQVGDAGGGAGVVERDPLRAHGIAGCDDQVGVIADLFQRVTLDLDRGRGETMGMILDRQDQLPDQIPVPLHERTPSVDKPIRLKIISEGEYQNTRVVDAETGRKVKGVVAVSWSIDPENFISRATFIVQEVPVEIEVPARD
jgi:hypothetical protein